MHANTVRYLTNCARCGNSFGARSRREQYCSAKCQTTVATQRKILRDASLVTHLKALRTKGDRKSLSLNFLLGLYERQHGRCALSGVEMTWVVRQGKVATNLSIDRIDASRAYSEDNVQLVCRIVNVMRNALTVDEFADWCLRVVENRRAISICKTA